MPHMPLPHSFAVFVPQSFHGLCQAHVLCTGRSDTSGFSDPVLDFISESHNHSLCWPHPDSFFSHEQAHVSCFFYFGISPMLWTLVGILQNSHMQYPDMPGNEYLQVNPQTVGDGSWGWMPLLPDLRWTKKSWEFFFPLHSLKVLGGIMLHLQSEDLDNTSMLTFLASLPFPSSPLLLPGITFQINYLLNPISQAPLSGLGGGCAGGEPRIGKIEFLCNPNKYQGSLRLSLGRKSNT